MQNGTQSEDHNGGALEMPLDKAARGQLQSHCSATTYERRAFNLSRALLADVEQALFTLRRDGCRCSLSSFVEIAVRELVNRPQDLRKVLEHNGARARRDLIAGSTMSSPSGVHGGAIL